MSRLFLHVHSSIIVLSLFCVHASRVVLAARRPGADVDETTDVADIGASHAASSWFGAAVLHNVTANKLYTSLLRFRMHNLTESLAFGRSMLVHPGALEQRTLVVLALAIFAAAGAWMLASAGMQIILQSKAARQEIEEAKEGTDADVLDSAAAVIEARHELLRSLIDSAVSHSEEDLQGPGKVLTALFKQLMERILEHAKNGLMEEEVMLVLESALESHSSSSSSSIDDRRQLLLDLLSSALQYALGLEMQGRLLSFLFVACQQQIRSLIADEIVGEKALPDMEAAKETDGLLKQRFKVLLGGQKASSCTKGLEGCLNALASTS